MKDSKFTRAELIQKSLELLKHHQHASGSFPASPHFEEFRYCFLRDASFCAYALLLYGEFERCRKFLEWCHHAIISCSEKVERVKQKWPGSDPIAMNELLPVRFELDGSQELSEWPNFQIDCYGTWLWCLEQYVNISKDEQILTDVKVSVDLTVSYLETVWTFASFDCWEEHSYERHTSSLACVIGGLRSVSSLYDDDKVGKFSERITEQLLKAVTPEGIFPKFLSGGGIDASTLWLSVPYGVVPVNHPSMQLTVKEIESVLLKGNGLYRYPNDTYYGGGRWPLLNCFLAWYKMETGHIKEAESLLEWVESLADENGYFPENDSVVPLFPEHKQKWITKWGPHVLPPLLWTQSMYLIAQHFLNQGKR
ncbi:MAG: glycoside hydrolase family 15 protein [Saonia sp.]